MKNKFVIALFMLVLAPAVCMAAKPPKQLQDV